MEWRQAARDDLRSIIDYIAEDNPIAALALLAEIETKVGRLPDRPKATPGRQGGRNAGNGCATELSGGLCRDGRNAGDPAGPACGADVAVRWKGGKVGLSRPSCMAQHMPTPSAQLPFVTGRPDHCGL